MSAASIRRPVPLGGIDGLSLAQAFMRTAAICGQVPVGENGQAEWQMVEQSFVPTAAVRRQVQVGQFDWNALGESIVRTASICGQVSMGESERTGGRAVERSFEPSASVRGQVPVGKAGWNSLDLAFMPSAAVLGQVPVGKAE